MTQPRKIILSSLAATARWWGLAFGTAALVSSAVAAEPGRAGPPQLSTLANLPLYFEANRGQAGSPESFVARGRGCSFFVAPTEAVLTLVKYDTPPDGSRAERGGAARGRVTQTRTLRFEFLGAESPAAVSGAGELTGKVNYLLGNDPAQWRSGVSLFTQVHVGKIYPGVDLVYYGNQQRLEYDFVVAPKSDPRTVAIRVTGADKIQLDAQGNLVFTLGRDAICQPKPLIYQTVAGVRKEISGGYRLTDKQTFAFQIGEYDRELPLVIDPVLSYSTFLGGTGLDIGWDIAVDTNGFVYVAGETLSAGLATPGAFRTNYSGGSGYGGDVFVAKFDNLGTTLSYLTYLGGNGDDAALGLAVDTAGNAYVTGFTSSTNFPFQAGLSNKLSGRPDPALGVYPLDAFVTKLNPSGSALVYSTYLGGDSDDEGIGIAVDLDSNALVTGFTSSTNFPTTNAAQGSFNGNLDAFVTKIASNGTSIVFSTYIGGTNMDIGEGIAADAVGNVYVTGFLTTTNNARVALVDKFSPSGTELQFLLFGAITNVGIGDVTPFRLALDSAGDVYIVGSESLTNFPATGSFLGGTNHSINGFLLKLAGDSFNRLFSVAFGGSGTDEAWDVAVDAGGNAHIVGVTYSINFPTTNTSGFLRTTNSGGADAFVAVISSNGMTLARSAYLGGSNNDFGYAIKVDGAGNDYIVGKTSSTNFPTAAPFQSAFGGTYDAFMAKIVVEPTLAEVVAGENVVLSWLAFAPEFALQSNTNLLSANGWVNVAAPPVLAAGWHTVTLGATNDALFFRLRQP